MVSVLLCGCLKMLISIILRDFLIQQWRHLEPVLVFADHKIEITHKTELQSSSAIVGMPLWNCTGWGEEEEEEEEDFAIHLAQIELPALSFVMILGFALLSGLAKLAFHHAHFLSSRIPESW